MAGVHPRTFADWLIEGCPGEPRAYDLVEIIAWAKAKKWCRGAIDGDPLLAGGDETEGLERYRLARAGQEEIKLAKLRKEVIDVDVLTEILARLSSILRDAGRGLDERFGNEAREIVDEALQSFEVEVEELFADSSSGNEAPDT